MIDNMLQDIFQGVEKSISSELLKISEKFFTMIRKKALALVLQTIVFTTAAICLLLGFILFAANFLAIEYVLLLFGSALLLGFFLGTK